MPDSFKHSVGKLDLGQETRQQCWYASFKMIFKYLKRPASQIESGLRGAGIDFDEAMKEGLLDTDFRKAADALELSSWSGGLFNKEPDWYDVGLSDGAESFLEELAYGPMWVSRKSGDHFHVVVAVGYNDDNSKIIYHNPYPGPKDAVEVQLKANLFVRNITAPSGSVQRY